MNGMRAASLAAAFVLSASKLSADPAEELSLWIPCCGNYCPGICFAKSVTYPNELMTLTILARDATHTPDPSYRGTVTLTSDDPLAVLPPPYQFTADDAGGHAFSVSLRSPGRRAIAATDENGLSGTFALKVVTSAVPDLGSFARAALAAALAGVAVTFLMRRPGP
jgi:hypothetical protein